MVYHTFNIDSADYIVEVGTHGGQEAIHLQNRFKDAKIYTYEADPQKWNRINKNLIDTSIVFRQMGLGDKVEQRMFYKFIGYENDGADSFFPRYNGQMRAKEKVHITTLELEMAKYNIPKIDILCMDTQGFEYFILKGLNERIHDVKNIIMELPDINNKSLYNDFKIPNGEDSVYQGAKSSKYIVDFLKSKGFEEVERRRENDLESNVHFRKKN
jgi:FkbM family methyltransferase